MYVPDHLFVILYEVSVGIAYLAKPPLGFLTVLQLLHLFQPFELQDEHPHYEL